MFIISFDADWQKRLLEDENISYDDLMLRQQKIEEWLDLFMETIATNPYCKVKFKSYNKDNYVYDKIFDAERTSISFFEYLLAVKANAIPDNYTVYEVFDGSKTYYVWCKDNLIRVGRKMK